MDGLLNLVGPRTITREIAGRRVTATVATLADYAEKESYILSLRPRAADVAAELEALGESPAAKQALLDLARRPRYASRHEVEEFDTSLRGIAWSVWRMLREHHSEFRDATGELLPAEQGIAIALKVIESVGAAGLRQLRDLGAEAEEKDLLPN